MLLLSHRRRERWRLGWECMADDGNDADAAQARRRRRGASAARLHRDADQPPPLILRPGNLTSWAAGVHKIYLSSVAVCFQITVLAAAPTTGCACVLFCARVCVPVVVVVCVCLARDQPDSRCAALSCENGQRVRDPTLSLSSRTSAQCPR